MATIEGLLTLSKVYPAISIIIAGILFFIGLKVATKLIKWLLWILATIGIIAAIYMLFV